MKHSELIEMIRKASKESTFQVTPRFLESFASVIAEIERESCAQLCESSPEPDGAELAERIRARGQA